jgi:hypothetical protein
MFLSFPEIRSNGNAWKDSQLRTNLVGIEMWPELRAFRPSLPDNCRNQAFTVRTGVLVRTRFFEIGGTGDVALSARTCRIS